MWIFMQNHLTFQFWHLLPKVFWTKEKNEMCQWAAFYPASHHFHLTCVQYGRMVWNLFLKYKPKAGPVRNENKGDRWLSGDGIQEKATKWQMKQCDQLFGLCDFFFQASLVGQLVKNPPAVQEIWVRSLGPEDPLEKGMATHSSILAWRIPWTEELGGLHSPWGCKEPDMTEWLSLSVVFVLGVIVVTVGTGFTFLLLLLTWE